MHELIGLSLSCAFMAAIVLLMLNRLKSPVAASGRFSGYKQPGSINGVLGAVVATTALSVPLVRNELTSATCVTVGVIVACIYYFLTRRRSTWGVALVSMGIGLAGTMLTVAALLTQRHCAGIPLVQRTAMVALLGIGVLGGWLFGRIFLSAPSVPNALAVFGALRVAAFLAAPLGVSLLSLPLPAGVSAFAVAGLLGLLAGFAPQFVIGLAAAEIAAASVGIGAVVGDVCSAGSQPGYIAAVLGCVVGYGCLRAKFG